MLRNIIIFTVFIITSIYPNLKVIGYFPTWSGASELRKVPFKKLTHINYAFVQSDFNGNVMYTGWGANEPQLLKEMVDSARANNITVMISVNGNTETGSHHILKDENDNLRKTFAENIVNFTVENDLDGIDLDIESLQDLTISERMNYGTLAHYIREEINNVNSKTLYLSAAVGWQCDAVKEWFSDEFVNAMDWLNPMVYDASGWWGAESFTNHAPYDYFVQSGSTEWPTRIAKSKIVLGVPFYGYTHESKTSANGNQVSYRDILSSYPNQSDDDTLVGDASNGYIIYDGPDAIRKKAEYVKNNNLGGIMIWHLAQDVNNERSLLNVIADVINPQTATNEYSVNAGTTKSKLSFLNGKFTLAIYTLKGTLLKALSGKVDKSNSLPVELNFNSIAPGAYIIKIDINENQYSHKYHNFK